MCMDDKEWSRNDLYFSFIKLSREEPYTRTEQAEIQAIPVIYLLHAYNL